MKERAYCETCREETPYHVQIFDAKEAIKRFGVSLDLKYKYKEVTCSVCGDYIYAGKTMDENLKARSDAYYSELNNLKGATKIALTGKLRSGKDTVADMMIKDGFHQCKLSSGIAEIIQRYFSSDCSASDKAKLRNHYTTIGQALRGLHEDVWIDHTWKLINQKWKYLGGKDLPIIVTDVRQQNEADFFREKGFLIVKIEADEDIRIQRAKEKDSDFDESELFHETELSVDNIKEDVLIINNGSLEELEEKVDNLLQLIK